MLVNEAVANPKRLPFTIALTIEKLERVVFILTIKYC